jgi:microcystin-dependent protein
MAIGEIKLFAGDYAPTGWAFCDGSMLQIAENRDLFKDLGAKYGGDGRTTFALPDLRGRAPMHRADGAALGTKGTITVEAARPEAFHARLALNFIIAVNGQAQFSDYDPFLGEVRAFAFNFAPERWMRCEGQLLPISQHMGLFSILDIAFGGDRQRTFALPDLREAYPFQPSKPKERGTRGGAWPEDEGTSAQTPLLTMTYAIAVEGLFPPRPS